MIKTLSHCMYPWMKKSFTQHASKHFYLIAHWGEVVKDKYAKLTNLSHVVFPKGKRNQGRLFVKVKSAHVSFLNYCLDDILMQVNTFYGYPAFSSLSFILE